MIVCRQLRYVAHDQSQESLVASPRNQNLQDYQTIMASLGRPFVFLDPSTRLAQTGPLDLTGA